MKARAIARRLRRLTRRRADREARIAAMREQRKTARARARKAAAARDALNAEVTRLRAELEYAQTAGRPRDDALSYLFIVTYGRSGSTLLQGILSAIPGYLIRGENGGVLQQLFDFHQTLLHHQQRLTRRDPLPPSHPWWGVDGYPEGVALRDLRQLLLDTVLRPGPDTRVAGFKEISWLPERAEDFLAFTRSVFPGARFILNTRNLDDVAQSKWWARRPDALGELTRIEAAYRDAVLALGGDAFHVHYDDYVDDPARLRPLFEWLGEEWDEQRVRSVLEVRHSY